MPGEILQAKTPAERDLLWKCRKMAVGSVGRLSPGYVLQDGVVPRTRLPHVFRRIAEIAAKHRVRIVNVAHAGDGNVHPILLLDERDRDLAARAQAASREVLEECIACGGSITAEHGVGIEKIELMEKLFAPADLRAMHRVRQAFDPAGRLNPGKKLPSTLLMTADQPTKNLPLDTTDSSRRSRRAAVAASIAAACESGTPVYPIGGGTSLDYGPRPARPGIGLCLVRMNRVLDYPADDLTVTVEAGITLAELNRRLAEKQQWLPIDAPATGEGHRGRHRGDQRLRPAAIWPRHHRRLFDRLPGDRRPRRGVCRRRPRGEKRGRVQPSAAMVGSLGTLGVITQLTFMVRPLPAHSALVICDVPGFQQAECLLAALGRSRTTPMIVELLAGPRSRIALCRRCPTRPPRGWPSASKAAPPRSRGWPTSCATSGKPWGPTG